MYHKDSEPSLQPYIEPALTLKNIAGHLEIDPLAESPTGYLTPEQWLWMMVLARAVNDLHGRYSELHPTPEQAYLLRAQARAWIMDAKRTDVGSFRWVCKALTINPVDFRKRAMKDVKKRGDMGWLTDKCRARKKVKW
jgi:hypothetical protein